MSTADLRPAATLKRPIYALSHAKRLRSKIPRRSRIPLVDNADAESSASCLYSGHSFDSTAGSLNHNRSVRKPITADDDDKFRRITRSYAKQHQLRLADSEQKSGEFTKQPEESITIDLATSDVSCVSGGGNLIKQKAESIEKPPEISDSSCLESISEAIPVENSRVQVSDAAPYDVDLYSDLACSERISPLDDGTSEYSTCNDLTVSEYYESELYYVNSRSTFSGYSLSDLADSSGNDFSERSSGDSTSFETFSFFLQLQQQFLRLKPRADAAASAAPPPAEEFTLMRFGDEEEEESYKGLRARERRSVVLRDSANVYDDTADCGHLMLEQRLLMVNWIVDYAKKKELHSETLFLGVSLMDRFLIQGYFKSERNLQLLGIACVTLATRIEENQPYNSVQTKSFTVGSNDTYSRSEVVAMEWMVMEVLRFKCFLPTTHNFLWFYLKVAMADEEVENLARYLAVLALLDHSILGFWPSTVAAGLVILACLATNHDSSCHVVMETHVRTKDDDLSECIQSLELLVKYAC